MSERPDPRLLARLLRQRAEMGAGSLFLDDMDRAALFEAARALARGGRGPAGGAATDPATGRPGVAAGPPGDPGTEPPTRPRVASPGLPVLEMGYDQLRATALACTRCGLAEGRTQVVFSDGVPDARVVVLGEAPGAHEDRTGLPFVGAAGRMLDLMLASVDLSRERNAYICNVLKCRPPGNRNPLPEEIEACTPYLRRQLQLVSPEVLLAVGTFAAQWLTGRSETLGKLRGEVHSYGGVPVVVTYHPAALLRNPGWTRAAWDDLQLLRRIIDEE